MKILFGLGNPGSKYAKTRHNIGFMVLDAFLDKLLKESPDANLEWKKKPKLKAEIAETTFVNPETEKTEKLLLVKPQTFMNLSGESVAAVLNFYKATSSDLTVIYDDLDLPLGTIRIREKGSAGTHNGMKSIIEHIGTEEFKRIRIGIESRGELAPAQQDTSNYVLSDFSKEEKPLIDKAINEVTEKLQ